MKKFLITADIQSCPNCKAVTVKPQVRIKSTLLSDAGFNVGDDVQIYVRGNSVVISKSSES